MFDRSAAVKLQLRDAKGRFIKMGSHVKWTSLASGKQVSGIVRGEHGNNVLIEFQHNGKAYNIHVPHGKIEVINQKAQLDAGYVAKMGGHTNTPSITDPGVTPVNAPAAAPSAAPAAPIKNFATLSTNETYYRIGSADGEKIHTSVGDLKVGDEVLPIATSGPFQKSPYNSKNNGTSNTVQKFGPGIGKVVKIKDGAYATIEDDKGKQYHVSVSHFVLKRDANTEKAVLDAQKMEASTIYAGKTPPALAWIDNMKGTHAQPTPSAQHNDADGAVNDADGADVSSADMPIGSTMPIGGSDDHLEKITKNLWMNKTSGATFDNDAVDKMDDNSAPKTDATPETPAFDASEQPVGTVVQLYDGPGHTKTARKVGKGRWKAEGRSGVLNDLQVETDINAQNGIGPKQLIDNKSPKAPAAAENPLGDNFEKLPGLTDYQKGDTAVLKDGSLGQWIGKGKLELEDGSKINGNKFSVDGKDVVIANKDITAVYRPKSNIVHPPKDHPFGDVVHGYNFDLSKPNNENFKAGDFVLYGKENNQGKIMSVNPTNILVQKLNSDKDVKGTPTIVAGQIKGVYRKDNSSTKPEHGFGLGPQQLIDNAEKMYGTDSKEHKQAQKMFGKDAAEAPAGDKLNSVDPAEDLTPAETEGIADSVAQKIAALAESVDFDIHPDSVVFWQKDGNPLVSAALEKMGVAKNKPTLVSDEEFAKLKADGHHVIYRGISGTVEGTTPMEAQQEIVSSDSPKIGNGLYGGGTYFTNNPDAAKQYGHSGGAVSTFALTPDAKMVTMDDVTKIRDDIKTDLGDKLTPKVEEALKDVGFVAVMSGFDGIFVPGGNGSDNGATNFYTVLNRGTMAHTENNIVASKDLKITMADMPWGNKKEESFGKAVPTGKPQPNPETPQGAPAAPTAPDAAGAPAAKPQAPEEAPVADTPDAAPSSAPAEDAPTAPPAEAPATAPATPESDATQQTFPDKGKSIVDSSGETVKANDMVHFAGKGVGKVKLVYPSTDSVKVIYADGKEHVHKSHKIKKVVGDAPQVEALPADLKVGDTGIDPNTHTMFIVGKNNTLIHKGDTVTHSSGDKGVVKAIYKGEKTLKIEWADGHSTGPKKASQLEAETKAPEAPQAQAPAAPEAASTPAAPARPYSEQDEKALVDFKDNFMEIGEHLRGSAEHAFPNAGEIIHGLDDLIGKSQLQDDMTVYRGFVTLDPKVIESLKPGTLMYEKSFTSTSEDMDVALDALELGPLVEAPKNHAPGMAPPEVEQSVVVKFELPKGSYAHKINYDGLSNKQYKQDGHEKEVILPRAYSYEIKEVADGTDSQGRPLKTVTVTAVHKSGASDQDGPGMHAVEANAEVGSKPFKILEDPGADGDGFHESGPWGHFGASGVMVEAPDPETGEPRYLIVENGDLHEEQNRGLWQLPGGAANGNENPYQAAAREMHEELEVDPSIIGNFEHAGDVAFENGKGWAYTNIGAKAPKQFDMKLDGYETSGAKWVSADELRKMRDDKQLLPAFGANVDNLLAVYKPKDDAKVPDANVPEASAPEAPLPDAATAFDINAKPLSIEDFKIVPGKESGGSNSGNFYTDKDGTEYYIKYNMHEGHARDEILASKIYQSLGVNAANQEMINMKSGKIGVASKIIETDGEQYNSHLNDPEYRKEAQADFAIDVLLANWDVAGIGNNNLLTDANGKPLRLDPGAALRFRAQGAPKSDFGPSAKEWDFLRTGANSESSSIKPTAKLFGDMTDAQLKESASKLHELTNDKIDGIVDSVGYDEKDGDFLKATLKARRDDILKRAGVEDTNNEGAPDGAGQTAGDGTTHEAGPEAGEQVPLDSGSGADSNTPSAAETEGPQHQVGDVLKGADIAELPVGTQIEKNAGAAIGLTKTAPGQWTKTDKSDLHPFSESFLTKHYDDKDFKVVGLPEGASEEAPKDLKNVPFDQLETGTTLHPSKGSWYFKKGEDGDWHAFKKDTDKASPSHFDDKDMKSFLMSPGNTYDVKAPVAEAVKPDWDGKTFADFGKDKVNDLPVGTKLLKDTNVHYFVKRESGAWQAHSVATGEELPNKLATAEQMANMPDKHAESYTLQAPEASAPDAPAAPADVPASSLGQKAIEDLPLGSKIHKSNGDYLVKEHGGWATKKADGTDDTIHMMDADDVNYLIEGYPHKFTTVESSKAPAASAPADKAIADYTKEDITALPVGSKIFRENGYYLAKAEDGKWYHKKADGTAYFNFGRSDEEVKSMMTNHTQKFTHVEPAAATTVPEGYDTPAAPTATGEHLSQPTSSDLDALPTGITIMDKSMPGYTWSKESDGSWTQINAQGDKQILHAMDMADGGSFDVVSGGKGPAGASSTTLLKNPSEDDLNALPDGTVLTDDSMPGYKWTKAGEDNWQAESPMGGDHHLASSSLADGADYNMTPPGGAAKAEDAPAADIKVGDDVEPEALLTAPVGTVFHGVGSKDWEFKKISDTEAVFTSAPNGTKYKIQNIVDSAKGSSLKYTIADMPGSAAPAPAVPDNGGYTVGQKVKGHYDLYNLPVGTKFSDDNGYGVNHYVKDTDTTFKLEGTNTSNKIADVSEHSEVEITELPGAASAASSQSGPSVKGKNGEQIFAGDDITWETKGILGKAVEVDAAANRVRMLYPDGSMKWYDAKKMVKQQKSAAPKSSPKPVKKNEGDPSSPLYGTPAPVYTAPTLAEVPSHVPDGFIEEIEKRYAAKINPSWSKATPQDSFYWTKVEAFQNNGDLSALETLHDKLYISDEMFEKAKEQAAKVGSDADGIKASNAKLTADALKAHGAALTEWKTANGVSSGANAISASFPQQASAEWDKATGFITNADGTQSADWSKAPTGSYAVADILKSLDDENLAAHGISAMIDSTSIMDSNVRFNKVTMPDGTTRIQAKFEVSEASRKAIQDAMKAQSGFKEQSSLNVGYIEYSGVGDLPKYDPTVGKVKGHTSPSDWYGKTLSVENNGTHIQFMNGEQDKSYGEFSNNAESLRSLAFITLPENATAADLEEALKTMGIADAHPSPKESVDFHKQKRLVSFFNGFVGERNTKYEDDPQSLKLAAEKILAEKGYSLEDFRLVMTENGFMNFRVPNALRDQLTKDSGIKALIHSNMDWVPQGEDKNNYNFYDWKPSHGVDRIIKKYAGGAKGYLPTAKRMLEGDDAKGMSTIPDTKSGGGRYLFMSPAKTEQAIKNYTDDKSGIVAHPSIAFQYLTNYGNAEDNMSGLREEGTTLMEQMAMKQSPNEAMIYNGLSIEDAWYSFTNDKQKPTIIKELKARDVHEINGIPVEEFFVIPGVDPIPEWKEPHPELG